MSEIWKDIPEYEGLYQINEIGEIKTLDKVVKNAKGFRKIYGKKLKLQLDKKGYYRIGLTKNNKQKFYLVHRLVAKTFISNKNNYPVVNHIDGNTRNNCVTNLEWCTYSYNIKHAYNIGLKNPKSAEHEGIKNPKSKLKEEQVIEILKEKQNNNNIKEAYKKLNFKISFSGLEQIWYGYKWKHIVEKVSG